MKKIVLSFIALSAFNSMFAQSWSVMTNMPEGKHMPGAAVIDTVIYVVGGYNAIGDATNTVHAFHPSTNSWTSVPPMIYARGELTVASANGKLYAMGGYTSTGAMNFVEEYDPVTNRWTLKSPMPTSRSQFSCAVLRQGGFDKIYATGGYPGTFSEHECFDPMANTWTTKAVQPTPRLQNNGGVQLNNKFYFLGGKNYSTSIIYDTCEVYKPTTNSWSPIASLPNGRFSGATATLRGKIYYMGGATHITTPNYNTNNVYDTTTNTWSSSASLFNKRSGMTAVNYRDQAIYLFGGRDSLQNLINWNHKFSFSDENVSVANTYNNVATNLATVYPNPSKDGNINIKLSNEGVHQITVANYTGELVYNATQKGGTQLQLPSLQRGLYLLSIKTQNQVQTNAVVVE